jgi:hypothetical protein
MTADEILDSNIQWLSRHPGQKVTCGNDLLSNETRTPQAEVDSESDQVHRVPALPRASNLFGFEVNG